MFEWLPWALDQLGNAGDQERAEKLRKRGEERDDNAIRRRVRDAKLAGIHPLAALGFSGAGASPVPFIPTDSGSDYFRRDPNEDLHRAHLEAQIGVLQSEQKRNEIDAARAASDLARGAQSANEVRKPFNLAFPWLGEIKTDPNLTDMQDIQNRWGEPGEWLFGGPLLARDIGQAMMEKYVALLDSMFGSTRGAKALLGVSPRALAKGRGNWINPEKGGY